MTNDHTSHKFIKPCKETYFWHILPCRIAESVYSLNSHVITIYVLCAVHPN